VGPFRLADAAGLDALERLGIPGACERLLPVDVLVAGVPRLDCSSEDALRFTRGQQVARHDAVPGLEMAVYGPDGRFLGVARCEAPGLLAPLRLMATGETAKPPDFA
jgi:tRNA pseudouridine55 synthase